MDIAAVTERAFAPARAAVEQARVPGAVLGLVTVAGDKAVCVAGAAELAPFPRPMRRGTWFDLASLTKVIFTTPAILRLADAGRISLDDPLTAAIPDLGQYDAGARERTLTFRQCLSHQTFLPHVEPIYTYGDDPERLKAFILQRVWKQGPPVYSDINFMLLGIAIERLTGKPLGAQPLPEGFTFKPDAQACAATERCMWRGRVMRGQVHDENAFALGGAAGHAGLFGTADGVLDFAQALMSGKALSAASLDAMREKQSETRALGWECAHVGWHGGDACSRATLGHTGFTGTGLWIDFDAGLAWTLLTNRVHPSRHGDSGILALRRETGALVCAGAGKAE